MPPSFRFVPDVTLIGLSSRKTACAPRRLCSGWPPDKQSTRTGASFKEMPGLQRLPLSFDAPGRYGVGRYNDNGLRGWAVVSQGNVDSGFTAGRCNSAKT